MASKNNIISSLFFSLNVVYYKRRKQNDAKRICKKWCWSRTL
jgi:hypothetical protein